MKNVLVLLFLVSSLSACKIQDILPSSSEESQTRDVKITKKSVIISPINKKKVRQKKKGLSISVEPINAVSKLWYKVSLKSGFNIFVMNGRYDYTERRFPFYKNPTRLAFRVKISNNTQRVFRAKNAVLTFNVDGESASVDAARYSNLANAIIVPHSSKTITVYGPDVDFLQKKKGIAHLGIYDIATGNTMSNFEWYFKYKTKKTKVKHAVITTTVKLTKYEAAKRNGQRFEAN